MKRRQSLIRWALIAALACGLAFALVNRASFDPRHLTEDLAAHRDTAIGLFLAYHVIASLFFVPRAFLGIAAGALFGPVLGFGLSLLGASLGALAGFWAVRLINGGLVDPSDLPRIGAWVRRAERAGLRTTLLVRLVPYLPHSLVNYAMGMARIRTLDYLVGSALGMAPTALIYVFIGASLIDVGDNYLQLATWAGAFAAFTMLTAWIARRDRAASAPGDPPGPDPRP